MANPSKEVLEAGEVVFRPLIEGMFVALSTLDPHAEKGVGETEGPLLGCLEAPPAPEIGEVWLLSEGLREAVMLVAAHPLAVVLVRLAVEPAAGQHDALHDLVVGNIRRDPAAEPLIPGGGRHGAVVGAVVLVSLLVVAGPVAELRGPPGGVGR